LQGQRIEKSSISVEKRKISRVSVEKVKKDDMTRAIVSVRKGWFSF
jgi:hypothetical protein